MECSGAIEGVHEDHCLHDLRKGEPGTETFVQCEGPGQICCWCGDLFLNRQDNRDGHGEYEPGITATLRKKREATGRKEARIKERAERQHRKDYGLDA